MNTLKFEELWECLNTASKKCDKNHGSDCGNRLSRKHSGSYYFNKISTISSCEAARCFKWNPTLVLRCGHEF